MRVRFNAPRVIAVLLAIGGIFWGVLLLPLIPHAEHPIRPLLVFGPGYLVTVAYLVRAITTPPLRYRQVIWVLSILVQGGWLALDIVDILGKEEPTTRLTNANSMDAWWLIATVGSAVALMMERAVAK
jgi:hypothetical protein